ncbi:ribokinase [Alkalicella caledoniensis]|uniref:Ribokinase n=1 Tax=Alkalicella caledoniensis TaxID=2731377 RepID=A0A7G9W932_ALKCA|nr:ribokinase [Alkalicella caledoniensis]QNO15194.1 ribokinase [Alkalicella caledoniensis]
MGKIIVVGSINMDLLFRTKKRPNLGETVKGIEFAQFPGGKGANQAVAASRLGSQVQMVGSVGKDEYGKILKGHLANEGVHISTIKEVDDSTGLANIVLDSDGENSIIIIEGANSKVHSTDIDDQLFESDDILLLQLEIPIETVIYAAKSAKAKGAKVIFDPAPVKEIPEELYQYIDIIKPNQWEAMELTKTSNVDQAASILLEKGINNVIITLGGDGAKLYTKDIIKHFAPRKVEVVDTTAAGDSFSGALATALNKGKELDEAINFAIKVSSLTVTRLGAQSSLPSIDEIGGE